MPIDKLTEINEKMKEELKVLKIPNNLAEFGVKNLNILFMGLCGAGKSSTIDTMYSIFKG
jgi:predicted GTPase